MRREFSFKTGSTPRVNQTHQGFTIQHTPQATTNYRQQPRITKLKNISKPSQAIAKDYIHPFFQQHDRKSFMPNKMMVEAKIKHSQYFSTEQLQYAIYKMLENMNINTKALNYFVNCRGLKSILRSTQQCIQAHFKIQKSSQVSQPITSLKTHSYKLSSLRQEIQSLQNQLANKKKQISQLNFDMARFKIDYQLICSKSESLENINKQLLELTRQNHQAKIVDHTLYKQKPNQKENQGDFMNICWSDSADQPLQGQKNTQRSKKQQLNKAISQIKMKQLYNQKAQNFHKLSQQTCNSKKIQQKIWSLTIKIVELQKQNLQLKKELQNNIVYINQMNNQYKLQAKKWAELQKNYEWQLRKAREFEYSRSQDY